MERATSLSNLEQVRLAWRDARFDDAARLLAGAADCESLLERARLAFFVDQDAAAADALLASAISASGSSGAHIVANALRHLVGSAIGVHRPPIDVSDFSGVSPESISESIYFLAMAAYTRDDFVAARGYLQWHSPSSTQMRVKYMLLEGFLAAAEREDFGFQASVTSLALNLILDKEPNEHYLIASCAETLSYLLRDIPHVEGLDALRRVELTAFESKGLLKSRFQITRTLGWRYAINGDYVPALRLAMEACRYVVPETLALYANLDYAMICIFSGQIIAARSSYEIARAKGKGVLWGSLAAFHAEILPLAAQVATEIGEDADALEYCRLAESHQSQIKSHYNLAHGARPKASLSEARAITFAASDPALASENAAEAYAIFSRIGYEWRAGRMALLLHQLTRKASWKNCATNHLAAYPASPFHRMLSVGTTQRTLTMQEQRILDLLQRGYGTQRIADELGRSPDTIRIHLGRLHRFFGVKNRHELLAKLAHESRAVG